MTRRCTRHAPREEMRRKTWRDFWGAECIEHALPHAEREGYIPRANGEAVSEPLSSRRYSGKFMIRVPPETHRRLAVEAAEAGVSLNRLASAKLAQ
jgi:predicted HicB family RNase H-like nuclease